MSSGRLENPMKNCEQILFTMNEQIITKISHHDDLFKQMQDIMNANKQIKMSDIMASYQNKRPLTNDQMIRNSNDIPRNMLN